MRKHVLVTGASSGLGEAMARHYASQGYAVTLAARREGLLEEIAQSLEVETFVRPSDLSELEQCAALIGEAEAALGPIDVLINNAGVQYVEPTLGVTPERGERLLTIDLLAPLRLIHHVLPGMIERGEGHIVNIASMAGLIFTPGMCHYNAAKAGLAAASESLRAEIHDSGVHVLTVYPGPVASDMETAAREQFKQSSLVDSLPTGTPEGLSTLVFDAMIKRKPRVVYPKVYGLSRFTRSSSQWFTDKFSPKLK